jgi:hypothetical protein
MESWLDYLQRKVGVTLEDKHREELAEILKDHIAGPGADLDDATAFAVCELSEWLKEVHGLTMTDKDLKDIEEILKDNLDIPAPGHILTPQEEKARKLAKRAKKFMASRVKAARYADKLRRMGHPEASAALMGCSVEELEAEAKAKPVERTEFHPGTQHRREMPKICVCLEEDMEELTKNGWMHVAWNHGIHLMQRPAGVQSKPDGPEFDATRNNVMQFTIGRHEKLPPEMQREILRLKQRLETTAWPTPTPEQEVLEVVFQDKP